MKTSNYKDRISFDALLQSAEDALLKEKETGEAQPFMASFDPDAFHGPNGVRSIHVACEKGLHHVLRWMLSRSDNPVALMNEGNDNGKLGIHFAASSAKAIPVLSVLLEFGADIEADEPMNGNRPLMFACDTSHAEVVDFLLKNGVDVHAGNSQGKTALHFAASSSGMFHGNLAVIEVLLNAGAQPTAAQKDGVTPLHRAASEGNANAVLRLIQAGADVNAKNVLGNTPLFMCTKDERLDHALVLLQTGADAHVRNLAGKTALERAASQTRWSESVKAWLDGKQALCEMDRLMEKHAMAPKGSVHA
jgi:26S proteasome non-ATPase regulatory subunit 10